MLSLAGGGGWDNPLAVIAVEVTFATPYAIFIFQQYSASIPYELDEAARIDGASPPQIFFLISTWERAHTRKNFLHALKT